MIALLRLVLSLGGRRAGLFGAHARARATLFALASALGLCAIVFLLVLITVALAQWLGVIAALAVMAGVFIVASAVVVAMLKSAQRRHVEKMRKQELDDRRMLQLGLLTALPALKRGGVFAALAAIVALTLLPRRGDAEDDDDLD